MSHLGLIVNDNLVFVWVYSVAFFLGLVYALLAGLLSGAFGIGHGDHDVGGPVDGAGGHEIHFSPLSPVVIAMFLTGMGGTGIICLKMFLVENVFVHLPVSFMAGFAVAGGTFLFFYKLVSWAQGTSLTIREKLVGIEAEVITAIPGGEKLGEIAYIANGSRYNSPARSEDGTAVTAHTVVVISRIVGNTLFVTPKHQIFK